MPTSPLGQLITFAVQLSSADKFTDFVWITVRPGDTIRKIAARYGHPELAEEIAQLNGIRSLTAQIVPKAPLDTQTFVGGRGVVDMRQVRRRGARRIKLPGTLRQSDALHVLADDERPKIKDGYAKFTTIDRLGRKGISQFQGYNPGAIDVPIQFEGYAGGDGVQIERDIQTLERFAGRGHFPGAAVGPPAVLRVSVTGSNGQIVPLIPENWQWSPQNPTAPLFRISDIAWADGALANRHSGGRRVRQKAVVTITEFTSIVTAIRSMSVRDRQAHDSQTRLVTDSQRRLGTAG